MSRAVCSKTRRRTGTLLSAAVAATAMIASDSVAALPLFPGPPAGHYNGSSGGDPTSSVPSIRGLPGHSVGEGFAIADLTLQIYTTLSAHYDNYSVFRWTAFGGSPELLGGTNGGQINNDPQAFGYAINRAGAAVGTYTPHKYIAADPMDPYYSRAVRWPAVPPNGSTIMQQLGWLPRTPDGAIPSHAEATALAINNSNVAVGVCEQWERVAGQDYNRGPRATRWNANSTAAINLGTPSTYNGVGDSRALAVSDNGIVTGTYQLYAADGTPLGNRAVRWAANSTTPITLGNFGAGTGGVVADVVNATNASGGVVGATLRSSIDGALPSVSAPTRWTGTSTAAQALGTLSGNALRTVGGAATDLNDSGLTVGWSNKGFSGSARGQRAVKWTAASTAAIELAALSTDTAGNADDRATATNNIGAIIGTADRYAGNTKLGTSAVLWRSDNSVLDLNTLIDDPAWHLDTAVDLSECGFIVGMGTYTAVISGSQQINSRPYMILVPEAGTYGRGDANFDTVVNFDDLILLAQNYSKPNATKKITVGDFNLDGETNFDDLIALAQNYNTTPGAALEASGAAFAADWALAQSLVPEPTMFSLATAGLLAMRRRR